MSVLHLYALVEEPDASAELRGLAGEPVRWVAAAGLAAAVGVLPSASAPSATALRAHDRVVRTLAARAPAVLPMRFGQTAGDEDALRAQLDRSRSRLRPALERVRGCLQLDLRVLGERPDPPAPSAPEDPAAGPGARYLAERGRLARARRLPGEVEALVERLRPWLRAERVELVPHGRLLGTLYHLVRASEREAYLAGFAAAWTDRGGLRIVLSGPHPAYAFAGAGEAREGSA